MKERAPEVPAGAWRSFARFLAGERPQAERPAGVAHIDVGPGGGFARGAGSYHGMSARWEGLCGEAVFSANASEAFRAEVVEKARAAGYLLAEDEKRGLLAAHAHQEQAETTPEDDAKLLAKLNAG